MTKDDRSLLALIGKAVLVDGKPGKIFGLERAGWYVFFHVRHFDGTMSMRELQDLEFTNDYI